MTIRRIVDVFDREIQFHQAAIRRLARRRAELIEAAQAAKRKEKARASRRSA